MRHYFLLALVITGCGGLATAPEIDASAPDAARETSETCAGEMMACATREDCCNRRHSCIGAVCKYGPDWTETGPVAASKVTYEADVQPLLLAKCVTCHDNDAGRAAFPRSYAVMLQPATLCPGERVGECVNRALQAQVPEGDYCRTVVTPFHREGWTCLTTTEINLVSAWIGSGMLER